MKKVIAILVIIIGILPAFSEKWVGNVATYNLPEGATMASGEKYSSGMISAACNGFRLGSTVQVINAKNGKSIDVVINDTVKPELSYFILLTPAAAREIDMEWDAGIAVVKGNFNDINSAVSLPIKGLVAEGEIDKENIKEFPEINWPVVADSSLSVRATEKPDIDKVKRPDNIEKDDKKLDADKEDKRYPYKEKEAFPSKKEENLIKYDYEFLPDKSIKTEKSSLSPTDEYAKSPIERSDKIFEDDKDRYYPKKEYVKSPIERLDKIFEDDRDRYDPKKEYVKSPIERSDKIFEDDKDRYDPKKEYAKSPIERVDKIFEDDKDRYDPKKEYVKSPDYRDKESAVDAFEEDPNKDTALKRPDIERGKIDISEDKEIEKGVDWKLYLKKGELYVRVLTSHNRVEAEKVFKNFGKIFGNAVPYKVGEKYIILLGPETKRTVGAILKMVRELGYRDAYIFEIK